MCEKKLDSEVYTIKGDKRYYCRKHAIDALRHKKIIEENDIIIDEEYTPTHKPYRREYPEHCEYPGCKMQPRGLDIYHCKACDKYHCPEHRIQEDHDCIGPRNTLTKEDRISYSKS